MARRSSPKPKVLSATEMTKRAQAFVAKWKHESREHAEAQSWWNDLFEVFGVDRYSTAVFERWATRASTGNQGRIDVFMPGVMIAEHKSLGADLGLAGSQAEDYLAGGALTPSEMPRYVVTTDFRTVSITDLEAPSDPAYEFPVTKLPGNVARFAFLSGYHAPKRNADEHTEITIKSARTMGVLYESLLGDLDASEDDREAHQAAVFMTRLLFLLFGDDADGLWENGAFQRFIEQMTSEDGSDVGAQIAHLFQILNTPPARRSPRLDPRVACFPWVNGDIFADPIDIPTFDSDMRESLLEACRSDWSQVSPAIFGSIFQSMATKKKRHAHGEHYTSEENILKTLRPLFLDDFELQLQEAWNSTTALTKLHNGLADLRYIDPACGSGNFLIVAYREMRDLELRLMVRIRELQGEAGILKLDATHGLKVTPDQFGGVEINWWPSKIAETAMFLVDHQANQRMAETLGSAPDRLPITVAAKIVHSDALDVNWGQRFETSDVTTFVFGNPPFLGKEQRASEQTAAMQSAWGEGYSGEMDFVTAWFILAAKFLAGSRGRFALVATNSIVQGVAAAPLIQPLKNLGWRIRFAHRTFLWKSEATGAAGVHCVIVGFDRDTTPPPRLFDYPDPRTVPLELNDISNVNGYLVAADDFFISERSQPLCVDLASNIKFGSMAADGGNLFLAPDEVEEALNDPFAKPYIRRFVGARELIHGLDRWCIWMPVADQIAVSRSALLRRHIEATQAFRANARDANVRSDQSAPYRFHRVKQPSRNYLCIPRHFGERRLYATAAYFDPSVVSGDANFTLEDADGYFFAIISSGMFIAWQKTVGGRIRHDPRFSSTLVWNNFPLPLATAPQRQRVIEAGAAVLTARSNHDLCLAQLYDPLAMPSDLIEAHRALDRVVDRLFGFNKVPSLLKRQERLFERYAATVSRTS